MHWRKILVPTTITQIIRKMAGPVKRGPWRDALAKLMVDVDLWTAYHVHCHV